MAIKKTSNITRPLVVMIVALVAALMINVSSASAAGSSEPQAVAAANGACGGGSSLSQMISGWKKHGVLDDVARSAGQTPGVDGSSSSIVKGGIVMVIVVRGGYVTNFTCSGGKFRNLHTKKYIPAGSRYYVPEKYAPAKCKKGRVKTGYEARCGNKQLGKLLVKRPCNKKPPKKPKPPKKTGKVLCANTGVMVDSIQQCVTQTQQTTQDCQAGTIKQGNQCVVIQNQCGNVNVGGDNNTQGGNCNVTNVCSNVNSPGGVIICSTPPPTCEQSGTCPPGDQPPQITCVFPAHVLADGGSVQIWCEASDPDGDATSINVISSDTYGHISGTIINSSTTPVPRYDGSPCPASMTCSRSTYWGDQITPDGVLTTIIATATANGKSATSVGRFPIRSGNLGF